MKKWVGLVLVLAALVLGGYYGMGFVTERTLEKNISVINQTNGLTVSISHYDRGLTTSNALLNWQLHTPARLVKDQNGQTTSAPAQDYKIEMPLTIYHGPIIFSDAGIQFGLGYAHSDVSMPETYAAQWANLFTSQSTRPNLSLSLFVNYLNKSKLNIEVPTFKLIFKQDGDQFLWDGMDSFVDVSSTMQNISGGFTINGARLIKNKMKATLGKVTSDYDLHLTEAGIYLGDANLLAPSFVVSENDQVIFAVEQFSMHSSSDINSGLFCSHFNTSLGKMVANSKTYGPLTLKMSLRNLDAQVLAELNTEANKAQQGSDIERQRALFAMLPQLPKLLSKGAQFEISKLNVVVPEGSIEGSMSISLPHGDTPNPFQLLQKLVGHGKLQVPESLLKEVIITSVKHNLMANPALQSALSDPPTTTAPANQASSHPEAPSAPSPTAKPALGAPEPISSGSLPGGEPKAIAESHAVTQPPTPQTNSASAKSWTDAELQQKSEVLADQKLATMVSSGLVTLQGKAYVIELNLAQGQLTVNGKPFTPAMMQF